MLIDPSLAFGDGYSQGIIEVEGGLIAFNEAIDQCTELMAQHFPPGNNEQNLLPDHLIQIAPG